jgi:hypothetical protein
MQKGPWLPLKGLNGFFHQHLVGEYSTEVNQNKQHGEPDFEFMFRTCTDHIILKDEGREIKTDSKTIAPVSL